VGVGWNDGTQSSNVREKCFGTLAVCLAPVNASARGHAYGQRCSEIPGTAVAQSRGLGNNLVSGRVKIVGKLNLHHRSQPVCTHPDRRADNASFGDRSVKHPVLSVLGLQTFRTTEDATEIADILAKDDDVLVALQRDVHG